MRKEIKILTMMAFAFCLGFGINNFAVSNIPCNFKVAVVDTQQIINASKEIQTLKIEKQTKEQNLQKWAESAQINIKKQTNSENKKKLIKKYSIELEKRQKSNYTQYTNKLRAIDNKISAQIQEKAKANGYNLVLVKGVVLSGGTDITADLVKIIK